MLKSKIKPIHILTAVICGLVVAGFWLSAASERKTVIDPSEPGKVIIDTEQEGKTIISSVFLKEDLPVTSGLVLHLDADAIEGLNDNDTIAQWDDLSGENNHAAQATEANKPIYKTGILNSKPVVRFDGVDDYLIVATGIPAVHIAFFVVERKTTKSTMGFFETVTLGTVNHTTPNTLLQFDSDTLKHYNVTVAYINFDTTTVNQPYVISMTRDATPERSGWLDGVSKFSNQPANTGGDNVNMNFGVGYNAFAQIDFAEVAIYNRVLTTEEREEVEQYLGVKWLGW